MELEKSGRDVTAMNIWELSLYGSRRDSLAWSGIEQIEYQKDAMRCSGQILTDLMGACPAAPTYWTPEAPFLDATGTFINKFSVWLAPADRPVDSD